MPMTMPGSPMSEGRFLSDALAFLIDRHQAAGTILIEAGAGYGKSRLIARASATLRENAVTVVELAPDVRWRESGAFAADIDQFVAGAPGGDVTILIDGYDEIADAALDREIGIYMRRNPRLKWIIASREKVGIAFGTRRLGGVVVRLSHDELRIGHAEIAARFGTLSADDVTLVANWSEGWPIAVEALRARMTNHVGSATGLAHALPAAERDLRAYIGDEIVSRRATGHRELLVETAFLDLVDCDLAETLTGRPDAWRLLDELHDSNIVTRADGENGTVYRCHPLVRAALRMELDKRGKRTLRRAREVAARWYRDQGDISGAIRLATEAGDNDLAAELVLSIDATMVGVSQGAPELRAILALLPAGAFQVSARLALAQAFLAAKSGDIEMATAIAGEVRSRPDVQRHAADPLLARDIAIVDAAIAMYDGHGMGATDLHNVKRIEENCLGDSNGRALVNNLLCVIALNVSDFPEALSRGRIALHYYAAQQSLNGLGYVHVHSGRIYAEMGEPDTALEHYTEARRYFLQRASDDAASLGVTSMFVAQALYDRGDFAAALDACSIVFERGEFGGYSHEGLYAGYRTLAMVERLRHGAPVAMRRLEEGIARARLDRSHQLECLLMLERLLIEPDVAQFLADIGDLPDLLQRAVGNGGDDDAHPWRIRDLQAMVTAKERAARGCDTDAVARLERQVTECEREGRIRSQLDLSIAIALAHDKANRREFALSQLAQAVRLGVKGGVVGSFVEAGVGAIALLTLLLSGAGMKSLQTREIDFIQEILRIYGTLGSATVSVFSPRELEVLHHLSRGLSNKLIARELSISPETVRFHLKGIYLKFGVRTGYANRRVVADFAAARGLVDG